MTAPVRVVFDCNVFAQALINIDGPAGRCITRALRREVLIFLSGPLIAEIRDIPNKRTPARLGVTVERAELMIENLLKVGLMVNNVPEIFDYPRDPDDAHYVNLALAAAATLIVSRDKDLLDLADTTRKDGQEFHARFPQLRILDPVQLLQELDASPSSPS